MEEYVGRHSFTVQEMLSNEPIWLNLDYNENKKAVELRVTARLKDSDESQGPPSPEQKSIIPSPAKSFNKSGGQVLKLTIIEADFSRDTEFLGKMDPFVVINYKN
jgi:hypothetical protein